MPKSIDISGLFTDEPFCLEGLIAPHWELVRPLEVRLEADEEGSFVVSDDLFLVYGEGATRLDAIKDYMESLIDYYQLMEVRAVKADAPTQAAFRKLQAYLRVTKA